MIVHKIKIVTPSIMALLLTSLFVKGQDKTVTINIDLSKIKEPISSLRITDDAGKVLLERKIVQRTLYGENENQQIKIDVSNFAEGIYFLEAITASRKFYSKFEVQK